MSKKEGVFIVDLTGFNLEGLTEIPQGVSTAELFRDWCIQAVIGYSEVNAGLSLEEQRRLKSMRDTLEQCAKAKEDKCHLEKKDYQFLMRAFEKGRLPMMLNEVVIRVTSLLERAQRM